MKKYIISLLLGVGILAIAGRANASYPTDDYRGIDYLTSNSSAVFITSSTIELIDMTLGAGNDVKFVQIIATAPTNLAYTGTFNNQLSTYNYTTPVTPFFYPLQQWVTPPMIFNTSTGTAAGLPKTINLRGTTVSGGCVVFKDSASSLEYWTLRYRVLR